MNLLEETLDALVCCEKTPEDIIFIGSLNSGHCCTWDEFIVLADTLYDAGYGAQEVAQDLVIVFSDYSYLKRWEYDGSEGWEYSGRVVLPTMTQSITSLIVKPPSVGWKTLKEINNA